MQLPQVRLLDNEEVDDGRGGVTHSFKFEITSTDSTRLLSRRYSSFRAAALAIQAVSPEAAGLPPFPSRNPLSRQTPEFLTKRGKALGNYLQEVLANSALESLPAVRALMAAAEEVTPSDTLLSETPGIEYSPHPSGKKLLTPSASSEAGPMARSVLFAEVRWPLSSSDSGSSVNDAVGVVGLMPRRALPWDVAQHPQDARHGRNLKDELEQEAEVSSK